MKIDPYHHKRRYLIWKEKVKNGIPGLSPKNSEEILKYFSDMEKGLNISSNSVRGPRSFCTLNAVRKCLYFLAKKFEERVGVSLTGLTEEAVFSLFNDMRSGTIRRQDGKCYKAIGKYVSVFKAFWHWHMKFNRKRGVDIEDITQDLDTSNEKPRWVYLTEEEIRRLCDHAKPRYRVLMMFLFDTGIRSPTELVNIRVGDLYDNYKKVYIRDEVAKGGSFGRKINLMLCADILKRHIEENGLTGQDQLFKISPPVTNRYLKRLAKRVLGDGESPAGEKYSNLTMYDFRHCSCCYWLPRYKSESALKYRFGWKQSDKIHYYSELLGMKDTITEEDMLIDTTKTDIEKQLVKIQQENSILKEKIEGFNSEARELKALVQEYVSRLQMIEQRVAAA